MQCQDRQQKCKHTMGQQTRESDSTVTDSDTHSRDADQASAETLREKKKHVCTYEGCTASFLRPNRLEAHIRVHTGEKPFKCSHPECDKAYTNTSHLKRHILTHTSTAVKVKCAHCSIMFSNRHNLKRHYDRVHKDPAKLTCKECHQVFTKRHQLQSHMAMHNDIKYECDKCNKKFVNVRSFKRHKLEHGINARKYLCTVVECAEAFPKWSQLQEHIKVKHPSEFKCEVCGKVFVRKWHLKRHLEYHKEDQSVKSCPYDGCPRLYFFKDNLRQHIRFRHLGLGYECDFCKRKLCSKGKLAYHIHTKHMSEKKPTRLKKKPRQRKDAGKPKRSMLSHLVGVDFPVQLERQLLARETSIQYNASESEYTVKQAVQIVP